MVNALYNLVTLNDNLSLHLHVDPLGIYIYSAETYASRLISWNYLQDFLIAGTADEVVANAVKDLVDKKGSSIYGQ